MNRHPVSLRGGQKFFFMAFHAILRQILNFGFSAISSHELSVCAIFYVFSNYQNDISFVSFLKNHQNSKGR